MTGRTRPPRPPPRPPSRRRGCRRPARTPRGRASRSPRRSPPPAPSCRERRHLEGRSILPGVSDLFSDAASERLPEVAPLAQRLRPARLDDFVGQEGVVGEGSALRLAIAEDRMASAIFYGPPGSGKTTLA